MKAVKFSLKCLFIFICAGALGLFGMIYYVDKTLPKSYKILEGEGLIINCDLPVRASYGGLEVSKSQIASSVGNTFSVNLKLFGVIPAGNASVEVVDELYVSVLGEPFGIKIYTEGVLVVGFSDVDAKEGSVNPAKKAGIKEGDFIVSLNGTEVYTNEEVASIIKNSEGEKIVAKIVRKGAEKQVTIYPKLSKSTNIYRAGVWVKDSSAGIGTLTFYSPVSNVVCGLGHGIADGDTGTLLTLEDGEFVTAEIVSVEKGAVGDPGELKGKFAGSKISDFNLNCESGVYGMLTTDVSVGELTRVALKQEVKEGEATLVTTVDGEGAKTYSCNIKIRGRGETQNLIVEVTDKELLAKTGGIVQGMSGSPILQNGKLVGAVTHVLVDEPTKGYGIFAENMLETAQSVAESNKLKEAS